jgi:hypothetical protein
MKSRTDLLLQSTACGVALLTPAASDAGKRHEFDVEDKVNGRLASRVNETCAFDLIKIGPRGRLLLLSTSKPRHGRPTSERFPEF